MPAYETVLTLLLLCYWGGLNFTYRIGKHMMRKEKKSILQM